MPALMKSLYIGIMQICIYINPTLCGCLHLHICISTFYAWPTPHVSLGLIASLFIRSAVKVIYCQFIFLPCFLAKPICINGE